MSVCPLFKSRAFDSFTPTTPHAHDITTHEGDVNFAARDVTVQKYYLGSFGGSLDIFGVLDSIRNLRKIHLDILSKATRGTGVWLLKTKKFLIWLDPNGNIKILWGTGIPGAGKTVLASIVIRELEALAAVEDSGICVCYVYIRYSDGADLTVRNILEILVKQTVERHSDCASLAEKAYARHLREKTLPTEEELLQLLHRFTKTKSATFYILDALDEAPDRIQIDLVQKLASLNARLFITSRPLEAVKAHAPDAHCFSIFAQEGDLDLHIAQEITRSSHLANLLQRPGSSLRDEIISLVKSKCGGMFLHASLQLDALCECATAYEVRRTLQAFPSKIEDVYRQTWQRILEQKSIHVLLAKAVLVWVLNAARPMTIDELECAVAMAPNTFTFQPDRLAPGTTLEAFCHGLVTIEEESKLVRLVHYTAKDTLHGLLRDSFPHPHSHLVMVCMTRLTECGFQNTLICSEEKFGATRQADPLLAYASDAWAFHARGSLGIDDTRRQIANFVHGIKAFPAFTSLDLLESFDILSPLHTLAIYNLPLFLIPDNQIGDPNVVTRVYQESPLTLASHHGHEAAAESLIAHPQTQINLVNNEGWSALMAAARYGHAGIATLLLRRPEIQVNLVDNQRWSALMKAARHGHEAIVSLLLASSGIQVNLVDNEGWSALLLTATGGHEGVAKLLLQRHDIQVNLAHNKGWSALMLAAAFGYKGIVKLLLRRSDIQVNLVGKAGWSALMLAAKGGHEDTVRLLLDVPHINTAVKSTENEHTAISIARALGYVGIVQLLQEFESRQSIRASYQLAKEWLEVHKD
ncbi:hypothetical protein BKA70DRAFT_1221560 [Coprinopsis sp. MPI-PUGE-AT-0042]|nr:hypothetical protein BKA70DRAFT_1221560 [Coprinopsis sp. MPI-PUGE-AT-0042]